jgi:hypothetical protein
MVVKRTLGVEGAVLKNSQAKLGKRPKLKY